MAVVLSIGIVIALIVALDAFGVLHRADPDFKDARAYDRRMKRLRRMYGRNNESSSGVE